VFSEEQIRAFNIGGEFEPFDQTDRSNELVAVQMFAEALGGNRLDKICLNESEPPDCLARLDGREVGVEVTRLVSPQKLAQRRAASNRGDPVHVYQDFYWPEERFRSEVEKLIGSKAEKYTKLKRVFDLLLIVTTQPWLAPKDVAAWLEKGEFSKPVCFKVGYIVLQHDPSWPQVRPVFRLFGDFW
jgi:hypothetical protein